MFASADGFFRADRKKSTLIKIDTLQSPAQYFAHNGNILFRNEHGWNQLGQQSKGSNLQLLNLFPDLRFIASDKNSQNLWLISGSNELYKFYSDKVTQNENGFPLFLKSITNLDTKVSAAQSLKIDQEKSSVTFEVVQPDYLNPKGIEFRYLLKGMSEEWSDWSSNNNVINFPYLPPGDYRFEVQAKNIFGKISELDPLTFEVLPPYWKRAWFYALEFSILASMVLLSFRLSTRFRIVSRLLSLLTIILLIQFIQTAIGDTLLTRESPVIDFFIQVMVALLILPVEGYLRKLMFESLDSSGKFYEFVTPGISLKKEKEEKFIKEPTEKD
jgi:hypothetical protein